MGSAFSNSWPCDASRRNIRREVVIMRFVKEKTRIPVPKVTTFGTAADNHDPSIGHSSSLDGLKVYLSPTSSKNFLDHLGAL